MESRPSVTIDECIELPSKPGRPIAYQLIRNSHIPAIPWLIVFVNGLRLPAESWNSAITHFMSLNDVVPVSVLSYDRFGQGYGHDLRQCARDLHELVQIIARHKLDVDRVQVILVAASIGAHISRIYARAHPQEVKGILILDSNIGHLEYSDLWPDPDDPEFDFRDVIEDDCTLDQYIKATKTLASIFNSDVKNSEGLDRRNTKQLLPSATEPSLITEVCSPWISVLGHDPITFASQSYEQLEIPRSISMKFINPAWTQYNQKLLSLTDEAHQLAFSIAKGCGHFIQKDDPSIVAAALFKLLLRCDADA